MEVVSDIQITAPIHHGVLHALSTQEEVGK